MSAVSRVRRRPLAPHPRPTSPEETKAVYTQMTGITTQYTDAEIAVLKQLRAVGGHATFHEVIRTALWRYAEHHEVPVAITDFHRPC